VGGRSSWTRSRYGPDPGLPGASPDPDADHRDLQVGPGVDPSREANRGDEASREADPSREAAAAIERSEGEHRLDPGPRAEVQNETSRRVGMPRNPRKRRTSHEVVLRSLEKVDRSPRRKNDPKRKKRTSRLRRRTSM